MWSACAGGYRRWPAHPGRGTDHAGGWYIRAEERTMRPAHPGRVERTMRTEESLDRNRPAGRNWETAEERRENGAGKSGY